MTPAETKARLRSLFGIEHLDMPRSGVAIEVPNFGRSELALVFEELRFDRGVEVGVLFGEYSEMLCRANPRLRLTCVDPWIASMSYHNMVRMEQKKFDAWEREARKRLTPYGCEIMKATSLEAAQDIPDRSLDFAYIDADHAFLALVQDLEAWTPKVKVGGILAGHDYVSVRQQPGMPQGTPSHQVIPVVRAWAEAYSIKPWYILGRKEKIQGEVRDRQRSWCWVVE